ncbi:two pore channel protein 2-like [Clytia hemisphaerica]|uniref:Ion transport domain-containing protein n=1 Tax=Clytia hemisphaerica TaxID=252671 RepID=A0A7M5VG87_9CNID
MSDSGGVSTPLLSDSQKEHYHTMSQHLSPIPNSNQNPTVKVITSTPLPSDLESGTDRDDRPNLSAIDSRFSAGYSSMDDRGTDNELYQSDEDLTAGGRETHALLQAAVFIEDAIEHRSICHKVDVVSLERYRMYHSKPIRWAKRLVITILLSLAFLETPSSLTISSDPRKRLDRYEFPCGVLESIELLCLIVLTADLIFRFRMVGKKTFKKSNWMIACAVVLFISYIDWLVSLGYVCEETWRMRRLLRPFFLIQSSSLMKKTVQSIQETVSQILSVLFLMALHLYFFTMLGMVLFSPVDMYGNKIIPDSDIHPKEKSLDNLHDKNEGRRYFTDLGESIMSLIILLTTANNPDVMMPAYSDNRFYALYFILFLAIGMYFFMNVLLAVIYNQFKGSFTKSMQSSFLRRRVGVRAAFEVLRGMAFYETPLESPSSCVDVFTVKSLIDEVKFSKKHRYKPYMMEYLENLPGNVVNAKQFQETFDIVFTDSIKKRHPCRTFDRPILKQIQALLLHNYFQYFGDFVSFVNVFIVTLELAMKTAFDGHSLLAIFNFCFIVYYAIEQVLMIYFIGPKRYFSHKNVWFESFVTWLLVILEILCIGFYGGPFPYLTQKEIMRRSVKYSPMSLYNILRITNMLIIIRLLRIIPSIKPLKMVASTLVDLVKNMRAFGGIVILIFYVFGIWGLMLFSGKSPQPPVNATDTSDVHVAASLNISCGSYRQLEYYANNFDDFAASIVVLWDVLVVNNWFVFLDAYNQTMKTRWAQLYFVVWWLVSVVICINLFVALVIEAFISQRERRQISEIKRSKRRKFAQNEETSRHFRVHEWFRSDYQEPTVDEIMKEINKNHYLRKYTRTQTL